jgi:hypothetical protein
MRVGDLGQPLTRLPSVADLSPWGEVIPDAIKRL